MNELFLEEGKLVSRGEWEQRVAALEHGRAPADAVTAVGDALRNAVLDRVPPPHGAPLGLLFSGGLDCSIIALLLAQAGVPFTAITVGFRDGNAKEPEDIMAARAAAKLLDIQYEEVLLDLAGAETVLRETALLLGEDLATVVNLGVGGVAVAAIQRGKALGITHFFGGLGAEELFAGYDRHERVWEQQGEEALQAECLRGLKAMWQQDLLRDTTIAHALGIKLHTPFLDPALIALALAIPAEQKMSAKKTYRRYNRAYNDSTPKAHKKTYEGRARGDIVVTRPYKKLVLREAAEALGLPHSIAWRPKRAAQYGSRLNNALTKLAKRRGFPHKDAYIRSLRAESLGAEY
ncbi:asparagine synthase [Candidatus Woesearchaeota archaeon]|nr:MAG: asparagine synthase [Candidatus Woesearchaeota archaeon]